MAGSREQPGVVVDHIEVVGSKPPYGLAIEISGAVTTPVDEDLVLVMHEYEAEFRAAVAEAFERIFLARLAAGEYRWAGRKRSADKVIGVDLASKPATFSVVEASPAKTVTIEDIEL